MDSYSQETYGSWPESLSWQNIRAVPSYHYFPEFARLVREQISVFAPDQVAVELPDSCHDMVCRAVQFLPAMTAFLNDKTDEILPITPEDSIIEAVRSACEKKIGVAFVDLDINHFDDGSGEGANMTADATLLEMMNLQEFMTLNNDRLGLHTDNHAYRAREEHMAYNLQLLAKNYSRVLFVCGMSHWKRIRNLLSGSPMKHLHQRKFSGFFLPLPPQIYYQAFNRLPFFVREYEHSRTTGEFSCQRCLTSLFMESAQECGVTLTPSSLGDLLKFSRNQAILLGRLAASARMILDAAFSIVGPAFERAVHEKLFEYPYSTADRQEFSIPLEFKGFFSCVDKKNQRFPLKVHPMARDAFNPVSIPDLRRVEKRLAGRKHPESELLNLNENLVLSSSWGRYTDEMEEEERFIASLERRWYHLGYRDEHLEQEFCGGFLDGLDLRETIRDPGSDKWFVREYLDEEPRFAMVLIEFDANLDAYPVPIYTYGRHKGLAWCSPEVPHPENPGTASMQFGAMLSFKRLIDNARLDELYGKMLKQYEKKAPPRQVLARIAFSLAGEGDILIVAPAASLEYYARVADQLNNKREAAEDTRANAPRKKINLFTLSSEEARTPAFDKIKSFNIYYHL